MAEENDASLLPALWANPKGGVSAGCVEQQRGVAMGEFKRRYARPTSVKQQ
jgi:hypothetical protein